MPHPGPYATLALVRRCRVVDHGPDPAMPDQGPLEKWRKKQTVQRRLAPSTNNKGDDCARHNPQPLQLLGVVLQPSQPQPGALRRARAPLGRQYGVLLYGERRNGAAKYAAGPTALPALCPLRQQQRRGPRRRAGRAARRT